MHRAPASRQQPPQRQKRYGWIRLYVDFPSHPKWRRVAVQSGEPLTVVKSVVGDLLCIAGKARARGHLGALDFYEVAIANDIKPEQVAAIYRTLGEIGWIEDDFIVDWLDRQPDHEDPTSAERQRNKRARDRAKRNNMRGRANAPDELILSRVTAPPAPEPQRPVEHVKPLELLSGTDPQAQAVNDERARAWLFGHGAQDVGSASLVVAHQLGQKRLSADLTLRRWYSEIGRDAVALAEIVFAADRDALNGEAFEKVVVQRIEAVVRLRESGPALPLGPAKIEGGRRG
jgi:hypothetical protein